MTPQDALLSTLPGVLGREPEPGEVLLVGVTDEAPDLAVVFALPGDRYDTALADLAALSLAEDGATSALVVAYSSVAPPAPPVEELEAWPHELLVRLLVNLVEGHGLRVLDALVVHEHRWWTYRCTHCLAVGGQTIPTRKDAP